MSDGEKTITVSGGQTYPLESIRRVPARGRNEAYTEVVYFTGKRRVRRHLKASDTVSGVEVPADDVQRRTTQLADGTKLNVEFHGERKS